MPENTANELLREAHETLERLAEEINVNLYFDLRKRIAAERGPSLADELRAKGYKEHGQEQNLPIGAVEERRPSAEEVREACAKVCDKLGRKKREAEKAVVRAAMRRWEWWDKIAPQAPGEGLYRLSLLQDACARLAKLRRRK